MARVRLIHPIRCEITPIDKTSTEYDDEAGEPIGAPHYSTPFSISAQIQWSRKDSPTAARSGVQLKSAGYILVKFAELERRGLEINRGDKITKMGKVDTVLYVTGFELAAHYADNNGAGLVQANFGDRWPSS